ncbi:N-6 DNA methylase [Clostridium saccharobutylicum]|uniref:site-specific DNA-methyltransferase (adenine-specific) n=2 Tax=Clostridium saccharobutylicum TaxID=169679 RepID=U5MQJ2_CLOSA|nr:N-6 DNA methylase [Clostridium saccharobutylicum]AGX41916.1 type I restriction-modification system methyltransferase subunit [Clostridium saccharobutylicum DSM 13864]MBA2907853.1 type I restriction enzyme M protein [Clostridium saccharobutylicum]MBA8792395.1 type I restriction enzyme M protein [Clostridium saccharobutylicum]MBA8981955.1 type I restriction enzyme M protein [Clostridium saccharobutylicum]MBA8996608.1 type I restriction enzyme M protein [Clostridium saccharobutylicum]
MSVYLMFLQHILYSLKDSGKAAIVVPTGFLTAKSGIEKKIRQQMIDKHMLRGVISMPSNIFATTGTNVSIIFIDSDNSDDKALLMDASKLGIKIKEDGKNQKTVLSHTEVEDIITTFNTRQEIDNLSTLVSYTELENKNYSFSAGQYYHVKVEYADITKDEFNTKMLQFKNDLRELFDMGKDIEKEILIQMERINYE